MGPRIQISKPTHALKPGIQTEVLRKLIAEWMIDRRHAFNEFACKSVCKIL